VGTSRIVEAPAWLSGLVILALALAITACGGSPATTSSANGAIGFVNRTQHSDAQLWALWKAAQQSLSLQIDLNPLQRELYGAAPNIVAGDPRALNVSPRQVRVAAQSDVSSSVLQSATGMVRPDPTGLISCPQPCNVHYAPAYSLFTQPTTHYAASWESSDANFDSLVQYEFENQILHALGYDTSWR
jgi:hypothetical protein